MFFLCFSFCFPAGGQPVFGSHRAVKNKTVIVIGCKITKSFSIHQKTAHFVIIYRHLMTPACAGGGMSVSETGPWVPLVRNLTKSRFLDYRPKHASSILQAKCKQSPFLTICRI